MISGFGFSGIWCFVVTWLVWFSGVWRNIGFYRESWGLVV